MNRANLAVRALFKSPQFLGAFLIGVVVLVAYQPALSIGFWTDDYSFIDIAGRLPFLQNLVFYADPFNQSHWYRPVQGMAWWVAYNLLHGDATWYHLIQILIHIANSLLLYALIARVSRRWRLAFLGSLIYATLPAYSLAVYWPGVADPLATLFYLLTLWFWFDFLQHGGSLRYGLTLVAFVIALLSKELNATLLVAMVLADLWLVCTPWRFLDLLKRYAIFLLILPLYALCEFTVLAQGVFTNQLGYGIGGHIVAALVQHLSVLAFPWGLDAPWSYIALAAMLVLLIYVSLKRIGQAIFVGVAALLALLPVLPFPVALAEAPRYLYLPLMASGILFAWLVERIVQSLSERAKSLVQWGGALGMAFFVLWSNASIAEGAVNFAGTARTARLQFRPIYEQHPTFPRDTFLYFINPPLDTPYINGMMFLKYGSTVTAYGADRDHIAPLRERNLAIIYFLDDQKTWREQAVDKTSVARAIPRPPIPFEKSISLVGYEVANPRLERGSAIFLLFYWQSAARVDKNYTVFVHLVDARGKMITGVDGPPRQPTSGWRPNTLMPDGMIIPIDDTVPPGDYHIELGLYDATTMQRLAVLDAAGQPVSDKVVIAPITVEDSNAQ